MKTADCIREIAVSLGASDVAFCGISPFERWRKAAGGAIPSWMEYRPRALMEDAASIIILIFSAPPYALEQGYPHVCSYYPRANEAYALCSAIADDLAQLGIKALSSPALPMKAAATRSGAASYGRCGLTFHKELGSYIAYGAILTNANIPANDKDEDITLSGCPDGCRSCAAACPSGALDYSGAVGESCLRRHMGRDVPDVLIPLMGLNLWGCELCQRACPRNVHISEVTMPEHVRRAFSVERILSRDNDVFNEIGEIIGRNYAKEAVMLSQALIVAANMGAVGLVPDIESLKSHPSKRVARLASIALKMLKA